MGWRVFCNSGVENIPVLIRLFGNVDDIIRSGLTKLDHLKNGNPNRGLNLSPDGPIRYALMPYLLMTEFSKHEEVHIKEVFRTDDLLVSL